MEKIKSVKQIIQSTGQEPQPIQLDENKIQCFDRWLLVKSFLEAIKDDPRITAFHISIYLSLVYEWELKDFEQPLPAGSHVILSHAKISSPATWHKCIKALHAWGYVEYRPSFSNVVGSLVRFKKPYYLTGDRL